MKIKALAEPLVPVIIEIIEILLYESCFVLDARTEAVMKLYAKLSMSLRTAEDPVEALFGGEK